MSQSIERWLPVSGHEGYYEVSDQGRVRSLDRTIPDGRRYRGVIRKAKRLNHGHLIVSLSQLGVVCEHLVHRLVLEAFTGPCPDGMEACHHDDNPENNRLTNLRWGTRRSNNHDRVRNGIHPMSQRTHCPFGHPLERPNLVPARLAAGTRTCLACSRGRSAAKRWGMSHQEASDIHYSRIGANRQP